MKNRKIGSDASLTNYINDCKWMLINIKFKKCHGIWKTAPLVNHSIENFMELMEKNCFVCFLAASHQSI